MPKIVPISRQQFQDKRWLRPTDFSFASGFPAVPLVGPEMARTALVMPMGFIKQGEQFIAVTLLSPLPGRNYFVGPEGQWLGAYLPASLRCYPFTLARTETEGEHVLCFDEASGLLTSNSDPAGIDFFAADGRLAPDTKWTVDFLNELERNRALTAISVAALARAGVLHPWPIRLGTEGETKTIENLYRVDESALNQLSDEDFIALRRAGALPLAYMQMLSAANMSIFTRLAQLQEQLKKAAAPSAAAAPTSPAAMEEFFKMIDPDHQLFG